MIIWETKKNEFSNYILSFDENRTNIDFVNFFTDFLYGCVSDASLIVGNGVTSSGRQVLFNIVQDFFNTQKDVELTTLDYINFATKIVNNYFTTIVIQGLPPHPPTVQPTTGVVVTYYGDFTTFGNMLYDAFNMPMNSNQNGTVSTNIISSKVILAIQTVFMTISGQYFGLMPTPNGLVPSPPIPWVGIR